jgi:NCS1 family nucleobase:cation symporter-1
VHFLGHSGLEVICYVVVWALQLLIIQRGMETVRKFQDWAGPPSGSDAGARHRPVREGRGPSPLTSGIPRDVLLEKTKDAGVRAAGLVLGADGRGAQPGSPTSRRST